MGSVTAEDFDANKRTPDEAEFQRLAKLNRVEYSRERKEAAKKLNIQVSVLDVEIAERQPKDVSDGEGESVAWQEIEPWPEPVDGAALLDALVSAINHYVVLPAAAADAIALWVLHAHAHDTAVISPILAVTSPTPECGKTTLLTILGALVPRPLPASNITAAALFRAVEKWQPSLLVDEADTFLKNSDELRGIINSGHNRNGAFVIRTTGDDHEPRIFKTWAAKAIALIGHLPPTLESRAIHIELRRKGPGEAVALIRGDRMQHFEPIARQAARWAEDHGDELRQGDPDIPAAVNGRRADNWRHLITIADAAGGDWPTRARGAAEILSAGRLEETTGIMLLADIHELFEDRNNPETLETVDILTFLHNRETRPWSEWGRSGKPMTARALASQLKSFKIAPGSVRVDGVRSAKGYRRKTFFDAWSRYITSLSGQPSQPAETLDFSHNLSGANNEAAPDRETPKPALTNGCDGWPDREPQNPENKELSDEQAAYLATLEDDAEERAALQDE